MNIIEGTYYYLICLEPPDDWGLYTRGQASIVHRGTEQECRDYVGSDKEKERKEEIDKAVEMMRKAI